MKEPLVKISDLSKSFDVNNTVSSTVEQTAVINSLNLSVDAGEFVTIFGPNGCGKTTLLNIITGVIHDYTGQIAINGKKPIDARIGYIFQNYDDSLFPWAKVWKNISFALRLEGKSRKDCMEAAEMLTSQLDITLPLDSYPYQLSGGQKQLVAICRALLFEPDLLVMDEPFSSLDHEARFIMQDKIQWLWKEKELTILFVSHEIDEAIFLADRLLLMTKRPSHVHSYYDISLPRPRHHKIMEEENFFKIRTEVLKSFREVMAK